MNMRAKLVAGLAVVALLGVGGCGPRQKPVSQNATPQNTPTASAAAQAKPTSPASPGPGKPKPTGPSGTPKPTGLPPGLKRTTGVKGVALTFDDGPSPAWTPKVLDRLRSAGVKATFCLVGTEVRKYPDLVARIVREGHQLCNHSWRHDVKLGDKTPAQIRADIQRTNEAIQAAVPGAKIPFYRQPGGRWTPEIVAAAKELGMRSLHWTVDPQDWAKPGSAAITKRVLGNARPGAVILMHDGGGDRSGTLAALPGVISALRQRFGIVRLT